MTYTVEKNLEYNKVLYKIGSTVVIDNDEQAKPLLEDGVIAKSVTKKKDSKASNEPKSGSVSVNDKNTKAEIMEYAKAEGVEVSEDMTKQQMLDALNAKN